MAAYHKKGDDVFAPPFEHDTGELLFPDRPEFSVYVALKLHIYKRLAAMGERDANPTRNPAAKSILEDYSARRVLRTFSSRAKDPRKMKDQFTDFLDVTPYFVRARLQALNHGTVLRREGAKGVRRAVTYRWNEPIDEMTLTSFHRLRDVVQGRLAMAVDLYRLAEVVDVEPFTRSEAIQVFQKARAAQMGRRWYQIATSSPANSSQFTQFLTTRLKDLANAGLLEIDGDKFRITEAGRRAFHWFELFVYSVTYET